MPRVLIVDDKPANLFLLRAVLTGYRCEVEEARDAGAALADARQHPPVLVIVSLHLPDGGSDALLRDWRADDTLQHIPLVAYGSYGAYGASGDRTDEARRALDLGAAVYLPKPADPGTFLTHFRKVLDGDLGATLPANTDALHDERGLLREYTRLLVRTLEEKVLRLEQANRELAGCEAVYQRSMRQRDALIALTGYRNLAAGELTAELRQIVEVAARTLHVARVSIWRYSPDRSTIKCVDLFDSTIGQHSSGAVLSAAMYPAYFAAVATAQVIAADDAINDPHTGEFGEDYLEPLGIGSMLDVPTNVGGVRDGVLSHEHVGPARRWTEDEKTFAVAMGDLVSLALDAEERRRAGRARLEG